MKPRVSVLVVGLAALRWGLLAAQTPTQASADSATLQGSWSMISGAADGYTLPPEYVQSMRRVFGGSEVTVMMGQQLFFKATVVLGGSGSVRTIDYHMTGGPTTGAVQLGIFAVAGDTVRFCFGAPNAPRPNDFTTTRGDGRTLSTWVRARP
jgi:uncharacterized protein (TIGR03067 family)